MRIALYSDCDSRGGVLSYTLSLSAELRKRGAKVTVLTHKPQNSVSAAIVAELKESADRVLVLPPESNLAADTSNFSGVLTAEDPDVFVPNYRLLPYAAAAACSRRTAIRSVGICHNDHPSYYALLQRYECCMSRFVCASARTSAQLGERIPWRTRDIVTIPHGVQTSGQPSPTFDGGVLRLIYHGRLEEEQKRISLLLEIARRLSASQVPFHLTLIGDGSELSTCQAAADEPVLRGRVSIYPSQDWAKLAPHLVSSHVAVLTSDYEGFCLSLAEGMGAGLPAVAFRCGGVIEQFLINDETGFLVDSGNIDAFVGAIARLQAEPALWARLSANACRTIRSDYTWSSAVKAYLDLFEDMLRDPARRRWPLGRPTWVTPEGRTFRSFIDRAGMDAGLWR